jgi:hypothetical protein
MKPETAAIVVLIILIVGGVCGWFWGRNVSLILGGKYVAPTSTETKTNHVSLALGDLFLFRTQGDGRGVIRFDKMTDDWGADYTVWYAPANSASLSAPSTGRVFDRDWRTRKRDGAFSLRSIGGDDQIECGPLIFMWWEPTSFTIPHGYAFAVTSNGLPNFASPGLVWHTSLHKEDAQQSAGGGGEVSAPQP